MRVLWISVERRNGNVWNTPEATGDKCGYSEGGGM